MKLELHLRLKSDATFGGGDGVAGLVDTEVEHDEYGLPYLRGRTLKGLLVEECANLLFALQSQSTPLREEIIATLQSAARFLFGQAGSTLDDDAVLHVGPATLPKDLRDAVIADVKADPPRLTPTDILESLTAIRRQTAVNEKTNAPEENSLRSIRVVLRETSFIAELDFDETHALYPDEELRNDALALLAASTLCLRRAGTGRNRGRGRLIARLNEPSRLPGPTDVTSEHFRRFKEHISGKGISQ